MQKNILAELATLLDDVSVGGSGSVFEGSNENVLNTFERLIGYVRNCTWSDNETTKFVACNFTHEQNSMAELWHSMYPEKPVKAQSTFRSQYQAINKYLENVLPENITKVFIDANEAEIALLNEKIDSLYMNDTRIEQQLGGQLCYLMSTLDLNTKKYSVSDCAKELHAMRTLSVARSVEMLEDCDEHKLAYCYFVLTRPPVVAGKVNKLRLEFIEAMLSMDSGVHLESIDSHVVPKNYMLIAVVNNILDLMNNGANIGRIMELLKLAIQQYNCAENKILIDGLGECYYLLNNGNEVSGVRNVLYKHIKDYLAIPNYIMTEEAEMELTNLAEPVMEFNESGVSSEPSVSYDDSANPLTGITEINADFFSSILKGKDESYARELMDSLRSACTENGIELEDESSSVIMTSGALDIVRSIAIETECDEDAMLNPDVINFLHMHCTKTGILSGLSKFSKYDIAYVVNQLDSGNKDFLNAIKTGINIDSLNKIGDVEMLSEVKTEIESRIEEAEPADFIADVSIELIRDYTIEGMKYRLKSVSDEALAKIYYDILNRDEETMSIIESK